MQIKFFHKHGQMHKTITMCFDMPWIFNIWECIALYFYIKEFISKLHCIN